MQRPVAQLKLVQSMLKIFVPPRANSVFGLSLGTGLLYKNGMDITLAYEHEMNYRENIAVSFADFSLSFITFVLNLMKELIKDRLPEFLGFFLCLLCNSCLLYTSRCV